MQRTGKPDPQYVEFILADSEKATLPLTDVYVGSWCHIVDTGVFGRFYNGHWYDSTTGAVIV